MKYVLFALAFVLQAVALLMMTNDLVSFALSSLLLLLSIGASAFLLIKRKWKLFILPLLTASYFFVFMLWGTFTTADEHESGRVESTVYP